MFTVHCFQPGSQCVRNVQISIAQHVALSVDWENLAGRGPGPGVEFSMVTFRLSWQPFRLPKKDESYGQIIIVVEYLAW